MNFITRYITRYINDFNFDYNFISIRIIMLNDNARTLREVLTYVEEI